MTLGYLLKRLGQTLVVLLPVSVRVLSLVRLASDIPACIRDGSQTPTSLVIGGRRTEAMIERYAGFIRDCLGR